MSKQQDEKKSHAPGKPSLYEDLPSVTNHEGSHPGRGPKGSVRSSSRVADEIIERLTDDEHIDAGEILVMLEGDVVTLTGNVPEAAMKQLAAAASGVRKVRNTIRVDDGSASLGQPGEAIRSGHDQRGSGFSSSALPDPLHDHRTKDANKPGG